MKKLYAGLAAAALTATGIACTAGAAHAGTPSPWPTNFTAEESATTTSGTTFLLGDDGSNSWLVEVDGSTVTPLELADNGWAYALTTHGDTAYVAGGDDNGPELWTVTGTAVTTTALPSTNDWPESVAVSADGNKIGISNDQGAYVYDLGGLMSSAASTVPAAELDLTDDSGNGADDSASTFARTGDTYYVAAAVDGTAKLWSIPPTGSSDSAPISLAVPKDDNDADVEELVAGADGTLYVSYWNPTADDGDDDGGYGIYDVSAVKDNAVTATQATNDGTVLLPSADGKTLYVGQYNEVEAYPVADLGSIGEDDDVPSYYVDSHYIVGLAATADGHLLISENGESDGDDQDSDVPTPQVEVLGAPGAPSQVTAQRGDTWTYVSFALSTSTGSSTNSSDVADLVDYDITLHDTTDPSKQDIVEDNVWENQNYLVGADDQQLVPGDAYTVSVTASNGLFTSAPATYSLGKYQAPAGGGTGGSAGAGGGGNSGQQHASAPAQVGTIKAPAVSSHAKKLRLKIAGVSTVPGKVKVYDGKKLIGKATIKNGKLVVKLKKGLKKGKHTIKLSYAGSASVAAFHKKVKLRVK